MISENLASARNYFSELIPNYQMLIEAEEKRLRSLNKKLKKAEKQQEVIQKIMCCCSNIEKGNASLDWNSELKNLMNKYFVDSDSDDDDE
jgi:Trp operon repressor